MIKKCALHPNKVRPDYYKVIDPIGFQIVSYWILHHIVCSSSRYTRPFWVWKNRNFQTNKVFHEYYGMKKRNLEVSWVDNRWKYWKKIRREEFMNCKRIGSQHAHLLIKPQFISKCRAKFDSKHLKVNMQLQVRIFGNRSIRKIYFKYVIAGENFGSART